MLFDAPLWIFPLLPALLSLLCLGVVYWALTSMAPLGNRPRLATPAPAPRASFAPSAAVAPPVARAASVGDNAALTTLLDAPAATVVLGQGAPVPVDADLTVVEGIGPQIAQVLTAAGIPTLSALAQSEPAHLVRVLREAGLNLAQPDTWPEQARLAVGGRFDELKQLQDRLRAGNRG